MIDVRGFEKALNRHGFGFQYRIQREAQILFGQRKSIWREPLSEFPVEVRGFGTRVDLLLKHARLPIYMIAECKRANPALSNWCFIKAPYTTSRVRLADQVFIEFIKLDETDVMWSGTEPTEYYSPESIYHLALEVKTGEKGDPRGPGRGVIEDAATQVCRGLNGIIDFFKSHPQFFQDKSVVGEKSVIGFLPVIFTTARLWTSNVDLGLTDLESGKVDLSGVALEEKSWLFYHYPQSPGLKHSVAPLNQVTRLKDILFNEYVRTITVVGASGITDFLTRDLWNW
jgi:hypothetical protein